jgi:sec-independent protein translocase protein TatB
MLCAVFGIGGSEILVILVIALLFLGPDKLPEAAKTISRTVRDLKKQGRILQQTIENDEHIGGAIRDLKSALRGDEIAARPPPKKLPEPTIAKPEDLAKAEADAKPAELADAKPAELADAKPAEVAPEAPAAPAVTLPPSAGEADPDVPDRDEDREELAKVIKPAAGVVAREAAESKHG